MALQLLIFSLKPGTETLVEILKELAQFRRIESSIILLPTSEDRVVATCDVFAPGCGFELSAVLRPGRRNILGG